MSEPHVSASVFVDPVCAISTVERGPTKRQLCKLLFLSALVALSAHILFLMALPPRFQRDQSGDNFRYYYPVATNLVAGRGLALRSQPALTYPPGIPMLYAATFWVSDVTGIDRSLGMRLQQAFFAMISAILVGLVAMPLFGWRIAAIATVLWSTYPFNLWLTKQPDPTPLLAALLLVSAFLFQRWLNNSRRWTRYGVLLGGTFAIAALTKPSTIALPILFVVLVWVCQIETTRGNRLLLSLCIVITYLVLLLPWEIWAQHVSGKWIPLCTNGPNVLIDGLTFGTERGLKPVAAPEGVRALMQDAIMRYPQLKTSGSIAMFVLMQVRTRPLVLAELFLIKGARTWYGIESHTGETGVILIQLCYLVALPFGLRMAWRGSSAQRNFVLVAVGIVAYFWVMTVFFALPLLRYMVPATCFFLIAIAVAIDATVAQRFTKPISRKED